MQQNNKCTPVKYDYHIIDYLQVSVATATLIRVHYKNTDKIRVLLQFVVFYQYSCKSCECTLIMVAVAAETCR
jgi:hypothetical protein